MCDMCDVARIIDVLSYIWMSHVTHMNESWHTYEWVMSHIWMSHVTRMNVEWFDELIFHHSFMCSYELVESWWFDEHMKESWYEHICVPWLLTEGSLASYVCHDSFICVPWLLHVLIPWLLHVLVVSFMWWYEHMKESWHTYEWVMAHIWIRRSYEHMKEWWNMSSSNHMKESWHTYEWVMAHRWTSHVTHMNESCRPYEGVMSHIWRSHVAHMKESCHTYE